jgi:hypothetical protein
MLSLGHPPFTEVDQPGLRDQPPSPCCNTRISWSVAIHEIASLGPFVGLISITFFHGLKFAFEHAILGGGRRSKLQFAVEWIRTQTERGEAEVMRSLIVGVYDSMLS